MGTADGLPALRGVLPSWGAAVARLPPSCSARFAAPLLRAPAASALATALGGALLGALGRAVLGGDAAAAEAALPLLVDSARLQRPGVRSRHRIVSVDRRSSEV